MSGQERSCGCGHSRKAHGNGWCRGLNLHAGRGPVACGCSEWSPRLTESDLNAAVAAARAETFEATVKAAANIVCMHRASTNAERPCVLSACCKTGWDIRALKLEDLK